MIHTKSASHTEGSSPQDEEILSALKEKQEAARGRQDAEAALEAYKEEIAMCEKIYAHNQPRRFESLADCYFNMGEVYSGLKNDPREALTLYKKSFELDSYNHDANLFLAQYSFDQYDYDFCGKTLYQFCLFFRYGGVEGLAEFLPSVEGAYKETKNTYLGLALMLAYRISGYDREEQMTFAQEYIATFPHETHGYHYLASSLFDEEKYEEALPIFEKILDKKPLAVTQSRFVSCYYGAHGRFPTLPTIDLHGDPIDLYSAGENHGTFFDRQNLHTKERYEYEAALYQASYAQFVDFWFNDKGNPSANHRDYFAMLCNNYGIVLGCLGRYDDAIPIHKTGYELSPFWQQLQSLLRCQLDAEKWQDVIVTGTEMLAQEEPIPSYWDLALHRNVIKAYIEVKEYDKAAELINDVLPHRGEITEEIEVDEENYHDDYLQYFTDITTYSSIVAGAKANGHEAVKELEDAVTKNPNDTNLLYPLLQTYHVAKEYQKCIDCANKYVNIKGKNLPHEEHVVILYRRGASYGRLGKYHEAIKDLLAAYAADDSDYWAAHELTLAYMGLKDYKKSKEYGERCAFFYKERDWKPDDAIREVLMGLVHLYHGTSDTDNELHFLGLLLAIDRDNKEAKEMKKAITGGFFGFLSRKKTVS